MANRATRIRGTEQRYIRIAIRLCEKALQEANLAGLNTNESSLSLKYNGKTVRCLSVSDTAKWAKDNWFAGYSKSTWRQYRSALLFLAEYQFKRGIIKSSNTLAEIEKKLEGSNDNSKKLEKKTSAKKMKSINDEDLAMILDELAARKSELAGFLSVWLYVNCLVGLRPSEWQSCTVIIDNDHPLLKVKNAKQTNGRSHGEYRVISLKNFTEKQNHKIVSFASACKEINKAGKFDSYYENCRKLLQRVCKKLWPRRTKNITLYSTRHQFSADLKKSGRKLEEIAYLMGHYSTDTATSHYGKRRYGRSKVTPDVPVTELSKIATKYKKFTFNRKDGKKL